MVLGAILGGIGASLVKGLIGGGKNRNDSSHQVSHKFNNDQATHQRLEAKIDEIGFTAAQNNQMLKALLGGEGGRNYRSPFHISNGNDTNFNSQQCRHHGSNTGSNLSNGNRNGYNWQPHKTVSNQLPWGGNRNNLSQLDHLLALLNFDSANNNYGVGPFTGGFNPNLPNPLSGWNGLGSYNSGQSSYYAGRNNIQGALTSLGNRGSGLGSGLTINLSF
ncbi:MAG TPA: hypothetical protein V6C96_00400 [Vampirovibrionales bacterium]